MLSTFAMATKTTSKKTLSVPHISIHASIDNISQCMEDSEHGVLLIQDLPEAPFASIHHLLQHSPTVTSRLNQAASIDNPGVLIYKDASHGKESKTVDQKCSLDLSPERLEKIKQIDPEIVQASALQDSLLFYLTFQRLVEEKLIAALAKVIGVDFDRLVDDMAFSYRMIDYYNKDDVEQPLKTPPSTSASISRPRLAEHRDFGFITLIQATRPGLQAKITTTTMMTKLQEWQDLPATPPGTALLMGGWSALLRSNGRLPAILHRVPKHFDPQDDDDDENTVSTQNRLSAVLFCNPKRADVSLDPIVREEEARQYIQGITAESLQQKLVQSKTETAVHRWLDIPHTKKKNERKRQRTKQQQGSNAAPANLWKRLFRRPA